MATSLERLISQLNTASDRAAESIIRRLVRIGKPAVTKLLQAAEDPSRPRVRKWSLQALGAIGDQRAAGLLVKFLRDEMMTVRLHALRGLGRMRYRRAAPAIQRLLGDESGGIRSNAIHALIELRDKTSGRLLIKALDDDRWYVRQVAARACGELAAKAAIPKLKRLFLADHHQAVRNAAKMALSQLSRSENSRQGLKRHRFPKA